jgi:MFS family permease
MRDIMRVPDWLIRAGSRRIVLPMDSTFVPTDREAGTDRGLLAVLTGDGRPLLGLYAAGLAAAGLFAWFLSAAGEALPHELRFLGLSLEQLRALAGGRVADFMTHDRVAFGGTLIAIGLINAWLVAVPLRRGERWAWWVIAATGAFGFASFLAYVGSAYIDSWHAIASAGLLAAFVPGLVMSRRILVAADPPRPIWPSWRTTEGIGRRLVALTGVGMVVAGSVILALGSIVVFVPQDLIYIGFDRAALDALNVHLVPLIAHDRTGFGGGVATVGLLLLGCVRWATWSRSLWQALALAGAFGFGAAIGVHGLVGYLDASHVGPAVGGALIFALGMWLSRPRREAAPREGGPP